MKQILQSLNDGQVEVAEIPAPRAGAGHLAIETSATVVSAGTERMLVEFGRANLISKARQQPDQVRAVLAKVATDGLATTLDAVRSKLDQPLALGYCNVGRVSEIGSGVDGFAIGDRVVSNGKHAEIVVVPKNLCARVPDAVGDEKAAFTVLAAIGLQGIRLVNPTLGEAVAVIGLGMIGLLTVQMLRAQGVRVLGLDPDPQRLALARQFGAETVQVGGGEDAQLAASAFSRGVGMDAVIITASTKSSDPVTQAAKMCRQRGRIVLVGVTGLELSRADFYRKELTFQVSCSYGPGRYDPAYEEGGQDYPVGFVRWTEQRNFEAVLDLMASGALDVGPLISHRFDLENAADAFGLLVSGEPSLGIVLNFAGAHVAGQALRTVELPKPSIAAGGAAVSFLGAGNYAARVLIPAFKAAGAVLRTVVSGAGVSAVHTGRKFGFLQVSTDGAAAIADSDADAIVVATRHDLHARQVLAALQAGKHVFCEKPLCLTHDELAAIEAEVASRPGQLLMVGFNRRFAAQVTRMKALLDAVAGPKSFVMTVNAGSIPSDHWTQDSAVGGGRIIGEACHFIDLLRHLSGARITAQHIVTLGRAASAGPRDDKATIVLSFADGSVGTIHYLANGHRAFPKERLEVFCAGRVLQLDNFRRMRGWGWDGFSSLNLWRQDKGNQACVGAFMAALRNGGPAPIDVGEIFEVSRISIELAEAARD
ncbi:bi-domain-containing oxidoreductase [Devosia sp. CAU 1758]